MVTYEDPYLPEIMKDVVEKVNTYFSTLPTDPFEVHYDRGIYNQVGNDRLASGSGFLMVWLVMPFTETLKRHNTIYCEVSDLEIIIAAATKANYSQTQREDINFFHKLLPVYERLKMEIGKERRFESPNLSDHKKIILPYWGGGDVSGPGQPNLWKHYADCIKMTNIKLKILKEEFPDCP